MTVTRRQSILLGAAAAVLLPRLTSASRADAAIAAFTGGAEVLAADALSLIAPELAKTGQAVPIEIAAAGAETIGIFATAEPNPELETFVFGPFATAQIASTRLRLAQSQEIIVVARMSDGTCQRASRVVRVTPGN